MIDLKNKEGKKQLLHWMGKIKKANAQTQKHTLAFAPYTKNLHTYICIHIYHLLGRGARQSGGKYTKCHSDCHPDPFC